MKGLPVFSLSQNWSLFSGYNIAAIKPEKDLLLGSVVGVWLSHNICWQAGGSSASHTGNSEFTEVQRMGEFSFLCQKRVEKVKIMNKQTLEKAAQLFWDCPVTSLKNE